MCVTSNKILVKNHRKRYKNMTKEFPQKCINVFLIEKNRFKSNITKLSTNKIARQHKTKDNENTCMQKSSHLFFFIRRTFTFLFDFKISGPLVSFQLFVIRKWSGEKIGQKKKWARPPPKTTSPTLLSCKDVEMNKNNEIHEMRKWKNLIYQKWI